MSESMVTIEAALRQQSGKSYCRKVRKRGWIPANLMQQAKATMIELDPKLLSKAWLADKKFIMSLDGVKKTVLIKELQIHAVKRTPLHVDLVYS
jgi:ribosomal protein L25 (general stress protein Ctc)